MKTLGLVIVIAYIVADFYFLFKWSTKDDDALDCFANALLAFLWPLTLVLDEFYDDFDDDDFDKI